MADKFMNSSTNTKDSPACWKVEAEQEVNYSIVLESNIFDIANRTIIDGKEYLPFSPMEPGCRRLIVIDEQVNHLYGDMIRSYFAHHSIATSYCVIRADEAVKDWISVEKVLDAMVEFGIDRRKEPVIAIGGGVLTDIVGFACSIYRRATPFIRIPTTLIGIVDAGVGVKTGVNFRGGKNKIGSYWQSMITYADVTFLQSLPERHIRNGLAEVLKIAAVKSKPLFAMLEEHGESLVSSKLQNGCGLDSTSQAVIRLAIGEMLDELAPNLWESKLKRCVDYGHSFSPAIELGSLQTEPFLLHGEAVNIDMAISTMISYRRGLIGDDECSRTFSVMDQIGLPITHPLLTDKDLLRKSLQDTVHHRNGCQNLPVVDGIGSHRFINDLTEVELFEATAAVQEWSNQ